MKHAKNISETAYLTTACRSKNPQSKDVYAKYLVDKKSEEFRKKYLREVSSKEDLLQAIRNRFFLEQLESFFAKYPKGIFVNLGAGFSMYPSLLSCEIECIEIDQKLIINEKKKKIEELTNAKLIPKRNVDFFAMDFNQNIDNLKKILTKKLKNRKSFILIEGLLYYLDEDKIAKLLEIVQNLQSKGSILGILILSNKFLENPIKKRFETFLENNINKNKSKLTFSESELLKQYLQK